MRNLLVTRRTVPVDRLAEYDAAWSRLREQVERAGGHAWRFRSRQLEDRFIEFIEWKDPADLEVTIREPAEALNAIASGEMDAWIA